MIFLLFFFKRKWARNLFFGELNLYNQNELHETLIIKDTYAHSHLCKLMLYCSKRRVKIFIFWYKFYIETMNLIYIFMYVTYLQYIFSLFMYYEIIFTLFSFQSLNTFFFFFLWNQSLKHLKISITTHDANKLVEYARHHTLDA